MCRRSAVAALLLILALSTVSCVTGLQPAPQAGSAETVLERFPIAKNSDSLLVPLDIKGKRYLFVLDTGATRTIYDTSLRHLLGEPIRLEKAETPGGDVTLPLFQPPAAKMGQFRLPTDSPVAVANLEIIRQASDDDVYGILGMDFLARHVIRLDFDRNEIVFLRSVGSDAGDRTPLSFRHRSPQVPIRIDGQEEPELFMVDTGMGGQDSGDMKAALFDSLVRKRKVSSLGKIRAGGLAGVEDQRQGRIESIALGGHRHSRLLFSTSKDNLLGLRFCSRYVMTFDFPNRALYLKKSHRFDWPDKQNMSGLHILRVKGETRIETVDKGSPASRAGIQARDVLVKLNGEKASATSLFVLRERFCSEGKQVRLLVRRGVREHEVSFTLAKAE